MQELRMTGRIDILICFTLPELDEVHDMKIIIFC